MLRYNPICILTRVKAYIISCNADINEFIKSTSFVLMVSNILGYMELKRLHNVRTKLEWGGSMKE